MAAAVTLVTVGCSLFLLVPHSTALKASELLKICRRSDPELNNCVKDSMTAMRSSLGRGIPQLKLLSAEPMLIPFISLKQGSGPVAFDSTYKNLKVHGITNYQVRTVNVDLENNKISFSFFLPSMKTESDYTINGKVLVLPIKGSGDSWGNYTDLNGDVTIVGHREKRKGKEFLVVDDMKFDVQVKKAVVHMNNLFNGNKQLGDAMNRFVTENWEVVFKEMKPVVDHAIGVLLKDSASKVFNRFPLDELLPK